MRRLLFTLATILFMQVGFSQKNILLQDTSLLFCYDFETISGGFVRDAGPAGIDGEMMQMATRNDDFGTAGLFTETDSSWVYVQNRPELNYLSEGTVMAWIHPFSYGIDRARMEIIEKTPLYWFNLQNGGWPSAVPNTLRGGNHSSGRIDSKQTIPLNTWTHAVYTFTPDSMVVYVNSEIDSIRFVASVPIGESTGDLGVGVKPFEEGYQQAQWNGMMDEVYLFKRALTQKEIRDYYSSFIVSDRLYEITEQFDMYPNPATDFTTVYLANVEVENMYVNIYSLSGELLLSKKIIHRTLTIDVNKLQGKGMYMVHMLSETNPQGIYKKLIVK